MRGPRQALAPAFTRRLAAAVGPVVLAPPGMAGLVGGNRPFAMQVVPYPITHGPVHATCRAFTCFFTFGLNGTRHYSGSSGCCGYRGFPYGPCYLGSSGCCDYHCWHDKQGYWDCFGWNNCPSAHDHEFFHLLLTYKYPFPYQQPPLPHGEARTYTLPGSDATWQCPRAKVTLAYLTRPRQLLAGHVPPLR